MLDAMVFNRYVRPPESSLEPLHGFLSTKRGTNILNPSEAQRNGRTRRAQEQRRVVSFRWRVASRRVAVKQGQPFCSLLYVFSFYLFFTLSFCSPMRDILWDLDLHLHLDQEESASSEIPCLVS